MQEAAREMRCVLLGMSGMHCIGGFIRVLDSRFLDVGFECRYRIFQNVCVKNQIGVLLTAHHADDQVCATAIYFNFHSAAVYVVCVLICL